MTVVKDMNLKEYNWNGTNYVASTGILRLKDDSTWGSKKYLCMIRDVKKTESRAWRIRQTMSAYIARAKIKEKVEVKYTLTGTCNGNKRSELDFYTRRKSKFRIQGDEGASFTILGSWMSTPYISGGTFSLENYDPNSSTYSEEAAGTQRFFVVIDSVSFSKSEGKAVFGSEETDLYDFTMELTRVDTGNVTNY